jgi:hypothetical protein
LVAWRRIRCFSRSLRVVPDVWLADISLPNRLTNQLDAMRRPAAFFQADADLSGKSGHFSAPLDVGKIWNLWR